MARNNKKLQIFSSKEVTPEMLQAALWDTLQKSRQKKLKPADANVVINAAKEICNIARLELQHRVLEGQFNLTKIEFDNNQPAK